MEAEKAWRDAEAEEAQRTVEVEEAQQKAKADKIAWKEAEKHKKSQGVSGSAEAAGAAVTAQGCCAHRLGGGGSEGVGGQ